MKMPEKRDLLAAILMAKRLGIGGTVALAFAMAYLHDEYNGRLRLQETVIDATMCAIIA